MLKNFFQNLIIKTAHAEVTLDDPLKGQTFEKLLAKFISEFIKFGSIIVVIMIIIGAFQMLFAQGKPEDFKKGIKTITYAIIGFAIILMASGIAAIIRTILTN